jgi:hypothetical protein
VEDDLTIRTELSEPAYAYLIAFRPDGTADVCDPEDEAVRPPKTKSPRYPPPAKSDEAYRLSESEGAGLQAFALVVSRNPLPPFREWKARLNSSPWRKGLPAEPGIVWRHDNQELLLLTAEDTIGTRGKGAKLRGSGVVVADLAKWLQAQPGVHTVSIQAFAVEPASRP